MQVNRTAIHVKDLQPVLLSAISDAEQADTNLEPQFIKKRSNNLATLYLDSQTPFFELNPNDIKMSSYNALGSQPQNLLNGINRLAVSKFEMFWQPVNVNSNNNVFTWSLFQGLNTYTFTHTIPSDNYDLTTLMNFIVATMNADVAGIPLVGTFNVVFNPNGYLSTLVDNVAGTTFIFDFNSLLVKNGSSLLAIPIMTAPATQILIGPSRMLYSRYVDIVSQDLCQFSKNPNRSINPVNKDVVLRQSLTNPNDRWTYDTTVEHLSWMNWNFLSPLSTINFRLYDEYGNLFFFAPSNILGLSTPTLNWFMEIILEV